MTQRTLFCDCGRNSPAIGGRCRSCYFRAYRSQSRFAGLREEILTRDGGVCRTCGRNHLLVVHHRKPGVQDREFLVTLCAACHARIHRLAALRIWVPEPLVSLWAEQHPGVPIQLQFPA